MAVENDRINRQAESSLLGGLTYDYFKAPLATLLESRKGDNTITSHDLIQAYALLYTRVKSLATELCGATPSISPAIQYLKLHVSDLANCIERDVRRALNDHIARDEGLDRDGCGAPCYPSGLTEDRFRCLKESVEVSHNALRMASSLFAIRSLYSLFSASHLEIMLDAVLALLQAPSLLTPGQSKTRSLALFALAGLRIPTSIARKKREALMYVVTSNLSCDATLPSNEPVLIDALKVLRNLLQIHVSTFLSSSLGVLERVLLLSVSESVGIRLAAGGALVGYAHAVAVPYKVNPPGLISTEHEQTRSAIRRKTTRFIQIQEAQRRQKHVTTQEEQQSAVLTLRDLLYAQIPLNPDVKPGPHIGWAFSLLGSLTILAGPSALTEVDHMKLVLRTIPVSALDHPWRPLRLLHGFLWRCIVWAFSLTPYASRPKSMNGVSGWRNALRQRLSDDIRQAQVSGVGACLIFVLLGKDEKPFSSALATHLPRDADVTRTIDVLKSLMEHPSRAFLEQGVAVLQRLTSDVGADSSRRELSTWDLTTVLPRVLLDGTLLDAELRQLGNLLQASQSFDINSIRALRSSEIEAHWEEFLELWVLAARRVFSNDSVLSYLSGDVLHIWQALLLAQVQLTPSYEHLTSTPAYSTRTLKVVKDFLIWDIDYGVRLNSVKQLWMVMKRVFAVPWLQDAAESLLYSILHFQGHDKSGSTTEVYRELCGDLVFAGKPDVLGVIALNTEDANLRRKAKELWFSVAPLWPRRSPAPAWQSTALFLSIPLRLATPAGVERTIWSDIFAFAVSCAGDAGQTVNSVLEELAIYLPDVTANALLCLLSYMQFNNAVSIPITLLQRLDDYIRRYPIISQDIYPAINVIDALSQSISACSVSSIIPILKTVQAGMCVWITAGPELISDDDYDQYIMGFYCNSLDGLHVATDSVQVLRDLEEYLCSPFVNIRKEAVGPLAFKRYWDRISSRLDFHDVELPEKFKNSLCAIYDAYGGDRPSYLPADSQSQSQSDVRVDSQDCVVPDSQPSADEQSLEMWYRPTAATAEPGAVYERHSSHQPHDELRLDNESPACVINAVVTPSMGGRERWASVPIRETPTSLARTKTLKRDEDKGEGTSTSLLGKRVAITRSNEDIGQTHLFKRAKSSLGSPGEEFDPAVHDSRSTRRAGEIVDHKGDSQPLSPFPRRERNKHSSQPHIDSNGHSNQSTSGPPQDSLPSPPLSVEAPSAAHAPGIKNDQEDEAEEYVDSSRIHEQELSLPVFGLHSMPAELSAAEGRHATEEGQSPPSITSRGSEFTYLEMLRAAHDTMLKQLADTDVTPDEVFAAQDLLHSMGGLLNDKLRSRLHRQGG